MSNTATASHNYSVPSQGQELKRNHVKFPSHHDSEAYNTIEGGEDIRVALPRQDSLASSPNSLMLASQILKSSHSYKPLLSSGVHVLEMEEPDLTLTPLYPRKYADSKSVTPVRQRKRKREPDSGIEEISLEAIDDHAFDTKPIPSKPSASQRSISKIFQRHRGNAEGVPHIDLKQISKLASDSMKPERLVLQDGKLLVGFHFCGIVL